MFTNKTQIPTAEQMRAARQKREEEWTRVMNDTSLPMPTRMAATNKLLRSEKLTLEQWFQDPELSRNAIPDDRPWPECLGVI